MQNEPGAGISEHEICIYRYSFTDNLFLNKTRIGVFNFVL